MDNASRQKKTKIGFLGVTVLCLVVLSATVSALLLKNTSQLDIGINAYFSGNESDIINLNEKSLFQEKLLKENMYTRYVKIENTGTEKGSYQIILTEHESVLEEFMKYCITEVSEFNESSPINDDFTSLNQAVSNTILLEPGEKQLYRIDLILDNEEFENYTYRSLGLIVTETRENWSDHLIVEGKENEKPESLETSVKPLPDDIWENDTFATGQGVPGATIDVTITNKDGDIVFQGPAMVGSDGEWVINFGTYRVKLTDTVTATQTEIGKLASEEVLLVIQPGG